MKNKMKLVSLGALTTLMFMGNFAPASAATPTTNESTNESTNELTNELTNEFEYLRDAIDTIDAVPSEERSQYLEDNREWIDEIGVRLEDYLETIPEEQQNDVVKSLLSDNFLINTLSLDGNLGEYFDDVWFHTRGGYDTYSMEPKWSVRLWESTMKAAWTELGKNYNGIRNDNGSLWNQYKCHWNYDAMGALAGSWDLEVGRPIVSEAEMIRTRCNPK
ncbi:DUF2599 domain-containing protein [Lysinibacillus xylanilyticus]|uniref:DUF2599 domain-containing protein n=1 Tax=Lysinibacillus xylanilyticus TaxID=582475 RepID=UPI003801FD51